jgi:hypothetical protein
MGWPQNDALMTLTVDGEAEEGLSFVKVEATFFSCLFLDPTPIDES